MMTAQYEMPCWRMRNHGDLRGSLILDVEAGIPDTVDGSGTLYQYFHQPPTARMRHADCSTYLARGWR